MTLLGAEGRDSEAEAFTDHFQRAGSRLWCVAVGVLGAREEAEDCLQEAALVAWSKWSEFQRGTSFGAWMSRIVRYTALNRSRRSAQRQMKSLDAESGPPKASPSQEGPFEGSDGLSFEGELFDDQVAAALRQLKEEVRTCLLLKVVADLNYSEISAQLEIPEGTAMSHVSRARTRLRELLSAPEKSR